MPTPDRNQIAFLGLGDSLAEARLLRGLELRDVERDTRIRARYLSALEQERFDALPGDAYGRVFVRTYAAYLGLDADVYAEEYRRRRGERREPVVPAPSAAPPPRSRAPIVVGAAVLVAAAAAALALTLGLRDGPAPGSSPAPSPATPVATRPAATSVAIAATRGPTSMIVRFGGPKGRKVWQGTLRRGRTMRLGLARPLWIRVGAPRNVEVRVGDERLPVGPEPLVLSSR
jgi:hypothetical protein